MRPPWTAILVDVLLFFAKIPMLKAPDFEIGAAALCPSTQAHGTNNTELADSSKHNTAPAMDAEAVARAIQEAVAPLLLRIEEQQAFIWMVSQEMGRGLAGSKATSTNPSTSGTEAPAASSSSSPAQPSASAISVSVPDSVAPAVALASSVPLTPPPRKPSKEAAIRSSKGLTIRIPPPARRAVPAASSSKPAAITVPASSQ
ncbi:hypothetical protein EVG20_g5140, partial [Dentipellis fragilis]